MVGLWNKNFIYLAVLDTARTLGLDKSKALPLFHAMTGCDTGNLGIKCLLLSSFNQTKWLLFCLFVFAVSFLAELSSIGLGSILGLKK